MLLTFKSQINILRSDQVTVCPFSSSLLGLITSAVSSIILHIHLDENVLIIYY